MTKRTVRLNSLLKEVLSEVIHRDMHHIPHVNEFVTITRVDITSDLSYATVFISMMGSDKEKNEAVQSLNRIAGPIAKIASKKVVMRYFPSLTFELDVGLDKQLRIEELLHKISKERDHRTENDITS